MAVSRAASGSILAVFLNTRGSTPHFCHLLLNWSLSAGYKAIYFKVTLGVEICLCPVYYSAVSSVLCSPVSKALHSHLALPCPLACFLYRLQCPALSCPVLPCPVLWPVSCTHCSVLAQGGTWRHRKAANKTCLFSLQTGLQAGAGRIVWCLSVLIVGCTDQVCLSTLQIGQRTSAGCTDWGLYVLIADWAAGSIRMY